MVFGWFDFEDIYSQMVSKYQDGATFVEIGAYLGKSTNYLAREIKESGKDIELYVIDLFDHTRYDLPEMHHQQLIKQLLQHGTLLDAFKYNMQGYDYNLIQGDCLDKVNLFKDNSIDFCFIDAGKKYQDVKDYLTVWTKKVKKGGYIGMHDYNNKDWQELKNAVNDWCKENDYELWDSNNNSDIAGISCLMKVK